MLGGLSFPSNEGELPYPYPRAELPSNEGELL